MYVGVSVGRAITASPNASVTNALQDRRGGRWIRPVAPNWPICDLAITCLRHQPRPCGAEVIAGTSSLSAFGIVLQARRASYVSAQCPWLALPWTLPCGGSASALRWLCKRPAVALQAPCGGSAVASSVARSPSSPPRRHASPAVTPACLPRQSRWPFGWLYWPRDDPWRGETLRWKICMTQRNFVVKISVEGLKVSVKAPGVEHRRGRD
jgi:hypothetical protein